jgi:GDP-L-fucose synthase
MIADEVGFFGSIIWDKTKPNGQPRRCLDTSRAQQYFGFRPQQGLREGIAKTLAWFLSHRSKHPQVAVI